MRKISFGLVAMTFISLGSLTAAHAIERNVHFAGGYPTGNYNKSDDDRVWSGKNGRDSGWYGKGDRDDRWAGKNDRDDRWSGKGGYDWRWSGKNDRGGNYPYGGLLTRRAE
jgi:hypothetical protein